MIWYRYLGILVLLAMTGFIGCGEKSSKTTNPSEPLARETGTTKATSLDPSKPIAEADGAENRPRVLVPASFTETIHAIDLRELRFNFFAELPRRQARRNMGIVRLPLDKVENLVIAQIKKQGCVLETNKVVDGIRTIEFTKGDFSVTAFVYEQKQNDSQSNVTYVIVNNGNIDSRTLPVPENCKPGLSRFGHATYTTKMKAGELLEKTRHRLTDDGWLNCSHNDPKQGNLQTRFVKNGIHVIISVSENEQERKLEYTMSMIGAELPVPPGAKDAHLDMVEDTLRCHSTASLSEVADYYRHLFEKLGWKRNKRIGHVDDDSITMSFGRSKDATSIGLKKADGHTTVLLEGLANDNPESR